MATHDYVIDNSTGANVRADLNLVLQAILSNNSSSSAPSTTAAYMWWADTTNGILKIRNSANNAWVELLQLDGTLTLEDGSVSSPALAFRDDLNTGVYSSAADTFNVATGGVERMELGATTIFNEDGADVDFRIEGDTEANLFYVDAGNEKIGIGVAAPTEDLHIHESANNTRCQLTFTNNSTGATVNDGLNIGLDGSQNAIIHQHENTNMLFGTNDTERMRIDSSGQVGIGTTSNYDDSVLEVRKASNGDGVAIRVTNATTTNGSQSGIIFTTTTSDFTSAAIAHKRNDNALIFYNGQSNSGGGFANATERMRIDSSGKVLIGATTARANFFNVTSLSANLQIEGATNNLNRGLSHTYGDASSNGPYLILAKHRSSSVGGTTVVQNNDEIGMLAFQGSDGTHFVECARIMGEIDGTPGADDMPGRLRFLTTADGSASPTERMRITSNGQIMHGCTDVTDSGSSVANNFAFSSDGNPTVVRSHSNMIYGATSNSADRHAMQLVQHRYNRYTMLSVHTNTGITGPHFLFYQGTNAVGSIHTGDSSTSFNTSSDYRLKENETVISDGITRLKTLIPRRFNWKIDETNTPVDGFFAHEVTAVPEAITGTKDQVATADDVSNELKEGDPIYQSIDQSKLVPLITAALQEAVAKIETLETKVAALEAA